jgi:hypothetical protein
MASAFGLSRRNGGHPDLTFGREIRSRTRLVSFAKTNSHSATDQFARRSNCALMMIFKGFDAASLSTAQAMAGGGSRPCRKHLQGMELGSESQKLATAILRGKAISLQNFSRSRSARRRKSANPPAPCSHAGLSRTPTNPVFAQRQQASARAVMAVCTLPASYSCLRNGRIAYQLPRTLGQPYDRHHS